jgi:hypothetical protein
LTRIALLWAEPSLGLYGNRSFDEIYKGFGHNSGNLAFVHAIASHIVGDITFLPWHSSKAKIDPYDIVVIPCANQLGPHTELGKLGQLIASYGKPVVAIGLGAQAKSLEMDVEVSEGTLGWVRAIAAARFGDGPNIWTRGPYTTRQLDKLGIGGAQSGNCPSAFINGAPDLGQRIHAHWTSRPVPRGISVAAGHQSWTHLRGIEQQLIAMMQDTLYPGQYVMQSAQDMVKASRDEFDIMEEGAPEKVRDYVAPHLTLEEFRAWCRTYARTFYDVPAWMESVRRHDLTIGPRYHGTALALQAERMGVCITIDSRTEELCAETGVPFLRSSAILDKALTRVTLKKLIAFDPDKYDQSRSDRAKSYVAFLEANGLQPADFLKQLADAA